MIYVGYSLLGLVLVGVMFTAYYFATFDLKVTVFPLYGSSKDGFFSVQKPKTNRVRWANNKTEWRRMWPLFTRKTEQPFDSEYIYPGKQVYAFELNDSWVPGRVNIDTTEDKMRCYINAVPHHVRNWQSLQHKKHAQEFAQNNFWEDNKMFIMGVITVLICCACCLATVYLTYTYFAPGKENIAQFASAIRDMNTAVPVR